MMPGAGDRPGWSVVVIGHQLSVGRGCGWVWGGELAGGFALVFHERSELRIVLISGAGKTTVEFLSTATPTSVWRLRS